MLPLPHTRALILHTTSRRLGDLLPLYMMMIPPIAGLGGRCGLISVDIRVAVRCDAGVARIRVRIDWGSCVAVDVTIVISMSGKLAHYSPTGTRVAVLLITSVLSGIRIVIVHVVITMAEAIADELPSRSIIPTPTMAMRLSILVVSSIAFHIIIDFIAHDARTTMPAWRPLIKSNRLASQPMRGIKRRPTIRLLKPPASLAREDRRLKPSCPRRARTVGEGRVPRQRDVVEAEVPDRGVHHAVGGDGEDGADHRAGEAVVPVMELVDGQRTRDQAGGENWGVHRDEFPECGVVVAEDLEFGVQVEVEEQEAGECRGAVPGGHRFKGIVDVVSVAAANAAVEHERFETFTDKVWIRVADAKEVRSEATDEPFDEDLEDGRPDHAVEKADDGVVCVPEGSDADLHAQDYEDWD
jgi:hypothetical protein